MSRNDELMGLLLDNNVSFANRCKLLKMLSNNPDLPMDMAHKILNAPLGSGIENKTDEMGAFGNVWVRKLHWPKAGNIHAGHKHNHDHISLLAKGSVIAHIEGFEPVEYHAPDFIYVKAEYHHQFVALEDDTVSFCVFALTDDELADMEIIEGRKQPFSAGVSERAPS